MAEGSLIEEAKKLMGRDFVEPSVEEAEKGAIRKFAQAIEDPNPLWRDEEYAKKTRYGGIIAPPLFLTSLQPTGVNNYATQEKLVDLAGPGKTAILGGTEYEWFQPVRPGDRITTTAEVVNVREREGKMGRMLILIYEMTFTNQKGEVVAKERTTAIMY